MNFLVCIFDQLIWVHGAISDFAYYMNELKDSTTIDQTCPLQPH